MTVTDTLPEFLRLVLDAIGVRAPPPAKEAPQEVRRYEGRFYATDGEVPF
jgi:hypothetical protein